MMNIQQRDWQTSDTPWKQLKKEKKAARKNRKNKRHENHNNSNMLMDLNNPAEENNDNDNILKSGIALFLFCHRHREAIYDNSDFFLMHYTNVSKGKHFLIFKIDFLVNKVS